MVKSNQLLHYAYGKSSFAVIRGLILEHSCTLLNETKNINEPIASLLSHLTLVYINDGTLELDRNKV